VASLKITKTSTELNESKIAPDAFLKEYYGDE